MNKIINISIILLLVTLTLNAQEGCSKFYPMVEGTSLEYTNYNKKDKVEGVSKFFVTEVISTASETKANQTIKLFDKKGKELFESNYNLTCSNNVVKIDYYSLLPAKMMQQYSEMGAETDISGTDIEIPNNLEVGQQLADAKLAIQMKMSGIAMNITVNQTQRTVEKKESVTTPAGTFECFVLTEVVESKTMGVTMETNSKVWIAEGVGIVKQESYKKNGTLMHKSELTKYSK